MTIAVSSIKSLSNVSSLQFTEDRKFQVAEKNGRIFSVQNAFVEKDLRGISLEACKRLSEIGSFVVKQLNDNPHEYSVSFSMKLRGGGNGSSSFSTEHVEGYADFGSRSSGASSSSSSYSCSYDHSTFGSRSYTSSRDVGSSSRSDSCIPDLKGKTFEAVSNEGKSNTEKCSSMNPTPSTYVELTDPGLSIEHEILKGEIERSGPQEA